MADHPPHRLGLDLQQRAPPLRLALRVTLDHGQGGEPGLVVEPVLVVVSVPAAGGRGDGAAKFGLACSGAGGSGSGRAGNSFVQF